MLLFGVAMVGIMVWRPRGIVGTRSPTIVLREKQPISKNLVEEARV
jgi:branched-chain amino acid transport system permease protein